MGTIPRAYIDWVEHAPQMDRPLFSPTSILTEAGNDIDFEIILRYSHKTQQDLAVIKARLITEFASTMDGMRPWFWAKLVRKS